MSTEEIEESCAKLGVESVQFMSIPRSDTEVETRQSDMLRREGAGEDPTDEEEDKKLSRSGCKSELAKLIFSDLADLYFKN